MTIRIAEGGADITSDTNRIAQLYNTSFSEHILVQRRLLNDPTYLSHHFQNKDEIWVVEECGEEIRGVAALSLCLPIGLGEIERVCVSKDHRGKGISLSLCDRLVEEAKNKDLGFIEAFARGDQPAMQRTFEKLGFKVYGISPRFEVMHDGQVVREQFVHMGLLLKPDTVDEHAMHLLPAAEKIYRAIHRRYLVSVADETNFAL